MTDDTDPTTNPTTTGARMTDDTDPTTNPTTTGARMTHDTDPTTNPTTTGARMTDDTDPTTNPATTGARMTDDTDPTTNSTTEEAPMNAPTDSEREFMTDEDESTADTQRMMTREDVARAILTGIACELGHDELRVLARIAERLKDGQTAYGTLEVATDTRNFRSKEAREEIEDALVYLACAWLKTEAKEAN